LVAWIKPLRLDLASLASRSSRISLANWGISQDETFEIGDSTEASVVELLIDDPSGIEEIRHVRLLGLVTSMATPLLRHTVVEPLVDGPRFTGNGLFVERAFDPRISSLSANTHGVAKLRVNQHPSVNRSAVYVEETRKVVNRRTHLAPRSNLRDDGWVIFGRPTALGFCDDDVIIHGA
jgi:hypothetical protein